MKNQHPNSTRSSETAAALAEHAIIAVVRYAADELQWEYLEAMIVGGIRALEVTLTTPGALQLIRKLTALEGLIVGVGSVFSRNQLAEAIEAGAKFYAS